MVRVKSVTRYTRARPSFACKHILHSSENKTTARCSIFQLTCFLAKWRRLPPVYFGPFVDRGLCCCMCRLGSIQMPIPQWNGDNITIIPFRCSRFRTSPRRLAKPPFDISARHGELSNDLNSDADQLHFDFQQDLKSATIWAAWWRVVSILLFLVMTGYTNV